LRGRLLGRDPAGAGADELHPHAGVDLPDHPVQRVSQPADQDDAGLRHRLRDAGGAGAAELPGILRGRTMLEAWRWTIRLGLAFTAVMFPTPEPVTLIGMSAAISSLFFAAVGISIWNDRRRDKLAGDEDLADDEASRIDDEVEPIDAPERGEKDRR